MQVEQSRHRVFRDNVGRELALRGMSWTDLTRGREAADRISTDTLAKLRAGVELGAAVKLKIARRLRNQPVDEMLRSLLEPADESS